MGLCPVVLNMDSDKKVCIEPGCDRPVYAKHRCHSHYLQYARAHNPRRCGVPGCDNPHFAKNKCWNHYRQAMRIGRGGGDARKESDRRYEAKRRALRELTGIPAISKALQDPDAIAKLRAALNQGDPTLLNIWHDLQPAHQRAISGLSS